MDNRRVLSADFQHHKRFPLPDAPRGEDAEANALAAEDPPAGGRAGNRTTDELAPETDNPVQSDGRIREYAITPGRVLRTLERVTAAEVGAGDSPGVRRPA